MVINVEQINAQPSTLNDNRWNPQFPTIPSQRLIRTE